MAKGYIIAHVNVRNADAYQGYVTGNTPIIQGRHGARYVVRGGKGQTMEGATFERHVVIEFESFDAALAAYNDPDYQAVADIRRANADSNIYVVEGAD
ncbi:DUF1330 domain-containing protein [Aestuariivita sp.]|jgi:uncharacterized protein (DUF1330 family)|uniref:DUF1330 domain-containing protein n=1 Tax=Aestuariivita sp. TaxID=1872407 RepID=UPI002173A429|nr:DUF1330 domain-containing protein [Aestuariivita sp.]MCE8009716.1 DUF1330 domain-containing protein [Aestuariivita sp.]